MERYDPLDGFPLSYWWNNFLLEFFMHIQIISLQRIFVRTWYSNPAGHGNSNLGLDPIREKLVIQFWERGGVQIIQYNQYYWIICTSQILWTHLSEKTKFEKEQFNLTTALKIIHAGGGVTKEMKWQPTLKKGLHNLTLSYKLVRLLY